MKSQRGWLAGWLCVVVALAAYTAAVPAQERRQRPESRDMRLLGHNDLQARSGYHPATSVTTPAST